MGLNARFWSHQFRRDFVPATERVVEVFLGRLIPTFSSIEEEAEKKSEKIYEELCSRPGDENSDLAELAEDAQDIGIDYYMSMKGLEQGILNTCAVFLYHMFEQQLMLFHRGELLQLHEEKNSKLFTHDEIKARLKSHKINIEAFTTWPKLEELRLLANSIKHGEGKSSQDLCRIAPELFESPVIKDLKGLGLGRGKARTSATIYTPLLGDDIYVTQDHIRSYESALKEFWNELGLALQSI